MSKAEEDNFNVQALIDNFLSEEPSRILDASHKVINSVVSNRPLIEALVPYLDEIISTTSNLNYGGAILSNDRFVSKAIDIIKTSQTDECLCEFAFEYFGCSAERLAKSNGFLLVEPSKSEGFVSTGVIQCPVCKNKYAVIEEYTGWHTTTTGYKKL